MPGAYTTTAVIGFPTPWPLREVTRLMEMGLPDGRVAALIAHLDGHLEVGVAEGQGALAAAGKHFQRLVVAGPNRGVLFTYVDEVGNIELTLNDVKLDSLENAGGAEVVVPLREDVAHELSTTSAAAAAATRSAVRARRDRFASRGKYRPGVPSRTKTILEQKGDLRNAIDALASHQELLGRGSGYIVPTMASQLRSLLYWPAPPKRESLTWNPLLLRLADYRAVGLPVFAAREHEGDLPDVIREAVFFVRNLSVSCWRQSATDQLMDIEQYLAQEVVTAGAGRAASVSDLLMATANSSGSAHYDEEVPLSLDDMASQLVLARPLLHHLVGEVADAVLLLGSYVLDE